ncbi:NnrU family protein [Sulfitobacter sp. PS-8MA]|uniref:NnrU family protein n=1 Tax=Sulfitobacter sp. PS-8MA TaxID=3237707 RepID=UPI0034C618DE
MSWLGFTVIFALFFATHSIPVRPGVKARIVHQIGARNFGIGYSILSTAMLALLIWSAGQAPYVQLWPQMIWQRHLVQLGMLGVCLLIAFAIARPNPFSFGGAHDDEFDPARPGFIGVMRHPLLVALALWAGLHLLPNGDLAHVILFAVLAGFAIAGRAVIDRRKKRQMGQLQWDSLRRRTAAAPRFSWPASPAGAAIRAALGIGAFVTLLWLHPLVIGVSAL